MSEEGKIMCTEQTKNLMDKKHIAGYTLMCSYGTEAKSYQTLRCVLKHTMFYGSE